ncbi:MAG: FAD-binding protein [Chloroflexota bacterium]|nr:FAD-binding protein [Chloroflexota bacterium]
MAGTPPVLPRRVLDELRAIVGADAVMHEPEDLLVYEYDAYLDRALPQVVVQPRNGEQVARVVRMAVRENLTVVARGGASGLSGGLIPVNGGIMIDFAQMYRVLEVDEENRLALVEPGLMNLDLSHHVAPLGLYYAPDPSSQKVSTIGGNIAENAGGPHCLSQGMTTNHVVGVEFVTRDGLRCELGGPAPDAPGYDLLGLVVGSEGTFGVVTRAWVRLVPLPPKAVTFLAVFETVEGAGAAVSAIVANGLIPSALELIDGPSITALEKAFNVGYPPGAGAVLLIDVEGLPEAVEEQTRLVQRVCEAIPGAMGLRFAESDAERAKLWAARKGALAAFGRIAPNYYLCDGTVPRSKLARVLGQVNEIAAEWGVWVGSVAHIGDGNLHPLIMFDKHEPGIMPRVEAAHDEIVQVCVDAGGTITGEHGVGLEKRKYMPWIFTEADMARMARVRAAFSPDNRFNPGKVLPDPSVATPPKKVGLSAAVGPDTWV